MYHGFGSRMALAMSARTAGVPALKSNKSERLTPPLVGHEVGH